MPVEGAPTIIAVIVLVLFFVSGAASLLLETVFRRELTLYVGSAATATSLTLATFLGGLAIGASLFGELADRTERPLRLYGVLELGVGATGGLVVALLAHGREALLAPVRAAGSGGAWVAAIVAAAVLLPPTILVGGTPPALVRHGARGREAALGAALGGFVLIEAAGMSATSSRATRFGLYRLGCDEPQLAALRDETGGGPAWRRQADMCARLTGSATPP